MNQMWEVVHQLAAEVGLRVAPSRPVEARCRGPRVAPPEDTPVVQSESDPRLRGEPLLDDDAPGPSNHPPWSAPAQPAASVPSGAPSPTPAPAPAPAPAPSTPDSPAPDSPAPAAAVQAANEPAPAPRRMPSQLLRLPPSAYTSTHDHPLSPCSKRAAEHLVRDYAERSKAWWGTFIEVWYSSMVEVQWLGANPAS